MSPDSESRPSSDELQFDHAIDAGAAESGGRADKLKCSRCEAPLRTEYFHVNGGVTCAACKDAVEIATEAARKRSRGTGPVMRALLFGLGASILGAVIYFAIWKLTDGWEFGLISILIGFMVGTAVMKGSRSHGGRRFQVLAVLLTYFAIGLSYSSAVISEMIDGKMDLGDSTAVEIGTSGDSARSAALADSAAVAAMAAASDSAASATGDSAVATATGGSVVTGPAALLLGLGGLLLMTMALPVLIVVSSFPGGLLSALIIGIGLQQAWTIPRLVEAEISGPYKVGAPRPAPAA
jgi:hypothetical protein